MSLLLLLLMSMSVIRMYSIRMRTVRYSGRFGEAELPRVVSAQGGLPRGDVCRGCLPERVSV